jgi:hypothetical protein
MSKLEQRKALRIKQYEERQGKIAEKTKAEKLATAKKAIKGK